MNITHEMKAPLSVIMGSMSLVENLADINKQKNYIKIAKHNCYRLLRLINNILDLSRFQYSVPRTDRHIDNITAFVRNIVLSVQPYAVAKNQCLQFQTHSDNVPVDFDPCMIERVLLNIISNAIKFTPCGGNITVCVNRREGFADISISDSGPGISDYMRGQIFECFNQCDSRLTRENEGIGIGLYLAKCLTELHGGSIFLNNLVNEGSEFIVSLPTCSSDLNEFKKSTAEIEEARNDSQSLLIEMSALAGF